MFKTKDPRMKTEVILDCEVYRNYFLAAFRNTKTGNVLNFEMRNGDTLPAQDRLEKILHQCRLVSFNGIHYDIPILSAALAGRNCAQLKEISDDIIQKNLKPWIVAKNRKFELLENLDHVDLIEVAPGIASLKIYGGRLHTKRMQDLPYEHNTVLTPEQMTNVRTYCVNDLQVTFDLLTELRPQIELREQMSEKYCLELRSKSDAQIAEAVIRDQVSELLQRNIKAPSIAPGTEFFYKQPEFLMQNRFASDHLRALAEEIFETPFVVADGGSVDLPLALKNRDVRIGNGVYRLGIGGLHSSEHSIAHYSDDDHQLIDRDVAAYYPSIILGQQLFPKQMGDAFLKVYRQIVDDRLEAKRTKDKVTDAALKIVINGSFGKFGSKWSALYAPDLLIQTTISGQLALLLLIDWLEDARIQVVSANTDGIVMRVPKKHMIRYAEVIGEWESLTGFSTEATEYDALYSRDVNNYIAIKSGGKGYKVKGVYAPAMLMKNPVNQVCIDAVLGHLLRGEDIRETILACNDIRKFVTIRQVKGGAVKGFGEGRVPEHSTKEELLNACGFINLADGYWKRPSWQGELAVTTLDDAYRYARSSFPNENSEYLGKAVRWYYSTLRRGLTINYKVNGYTVARSEGAQPLMDLPDEMPKDVDREWYIREAYSMLVDVGAI